MTGTEKQIKWAAEIKENVVATLTDMVKGITANPSFDRTNKQHAETENLWTSRIEKITACEDAAAIIDFFKSFDYSGEERKDVPSLVSVYKVSAENLGYNFK